ncbi:MAG: response regulator [Sandaracinaceae bacterium]
MNVLVVDDSRAMRRIMRKALAFAGVEGDAIREAEHGADALAQVRANPPSLVLSDINMPVMAGDAFLDAMQEEGFLAATPVVVVTSAAGAKTKLDLIRRGASRVIKKPFDPLSLHSQLEDLLVPVLASEQDEGVPSVVPADPLATPSVASVAPQPGGVPCAEGVVPQASSLSVEPEGLLPTPSETMPSGPPESPHAFGGEAIAYPALPEYGTEAGDVWPAESEYPASAEWPAEPDPAEDATETPPEREAEPDALADGMDEKAAEALCRTLEVSLMESSSVETSPVPVERMLLTASIDVRVPAPAEITLLCTYEVATRLAIALVGDDPGDDDGSRLDALAELSNMVAGSFVDAEMSGGVRPEHLGLPVRGVVLPGELVGEVWQLARLEEPDGAVYVRMVPLAGEMS